MLLNLSVVASVDGCPQKLRCDGISDYALVSITIRPSAAAAPTRSRLIPPFIFKHPLFAELQERFVEQFSLYERVLDDHWHVHKRILRAMGGGALVLDDGELLIFNSIARAVARNDVRLARLLMISSPVVKTLMTMDRHTPTLKDPMAFAAKMRDARHRRGQGLLDGVRPPKQPGDRSRVAQLRCKGCCSFGLLTRSAWCSTLSWMEMALPGVELVKRFLANVADSGTGPDGLPYSAWRCCWRCGRCLALRG